MSRPVPPASSYWKQAAGQTVGSAKLAEDLVGLVTRTNDLIDEAAVKAMLTKFNHMVQSDGVQIPASEVKDVAKCITLAMKSHGFAKQLASLLEGVKVENT